MAAMTEQGDRAGRLLEWIVVGAFSCLLLFAVAQAASWEMAYFVYAVALSVASWLWPLTALIAAVAGIAFGIRLLIRNAS